MSMLRRAFAILWIGLSFSVACKSNNPEVVAEGCEVTCPPGTHACCRCYGGAPKCICTKEPKDCRAGGEKALQCGVSGCR